MSASVARVIDSSHLPAVIYSARVGNRSHLPPPEASGAPPPYGVSFVIPAFNEQNRLGPTLEAYVPMLESLRVPFEILVVSSGTDDTPGVARRYEPRGVRVRHSPFRMGKGRAILEGFRASRFLVVGYADADGSVPAADARRLIRMSLAGDRVVVASRRLEPKTVWVREPAPKYFASNIWHALVRLLLDIPLRDAECGFKFFTKDLTDRLVRDVTVTNWVFDVAMLFHLRGYGETLKEVPVNYRYHHSTRMRLTRVAPVMLGGLLAVFLVDRLGLRSHGLLKFLRILNQRFGTE